MERNWLPLHCLLGLASYQPKPSFTIWTDNMCQGIFDHAESEYDVFSAIRGRLAYFPDELIHTARKTSPAPGFLLLATKLHRQTYLPSAPRQPPGRSGAAPASLAHTYQRRRRQGSQHAVARARAFRSDAARAAPYLPPAAPRAAFPPPPPPAPKSAENASPNLSCISWPPACATHSRRNSGLKYQSK